MALKIKLPPPPPINDTQSPVWQDWFYKLVTALNELELVVTISGNSGNPAGMAGDGTADAFGILDGLSVVPGPPGVPGARGLPGVPGQDGMDGNDVDFMQPPGQPLNALLPAFTNTRVLFGDGSSTPTTDADLTFATATNELSSGTFKAATTIGVGAATPSTSGAGITFPATQSDSTNANTLDDYEEGSWTIGVSFGGGTTGITYSSQVARYTKIGNKIFAQGRFALSSKGSSTGSAAITGLPFTTSNITNLNSVATLQLNNVAVTVPSGVTSSAAANSAEVTLAYLSAGSNTALLDTDFTNTSIVTLNLIYQTGA